MVFTEMYASGVDVVRDAESGQQAQRQEFKAIVRLSHHASNSCASQTDELDSIGGSQGMSSRADSQHSSSYELVQIRPSVAE